MITFKDYNYYKIHNW